MQGIKFSGTQEYNQQQNVALDVCYKNRKYLKAVSRGIQELTKVVTLSNPPKEVIFLKVPLNFEGIPYKLQRLYVKFLDCKSQTDEGIFKNLASRKWGSATRQHYRRIIKELLSKGWASPCTAKEYGDISLRAYQYVWRDLGIKKFVAKSRSRFNDRSRISSGEHYSYFKISVDALADDRKTYYSQIQNLIQKKIAKRKRAQIRWRLKQSSNKDLMATFGTKRAALLFGYSSASTGSKLRKKNFTLIVTNEKPRFNPVHGRWEDPCGRIAI